MAGLHTEGGATTRRGFFCFASACKGDELEQTLGLRLGLGFGVGLFPREKKEVIWHCLRTSGERPLLRRRDGDIGAWLASSSESEMKF